MNLQNVHLQVSTCVSHGRFSGNLVVEMLPLTTRDVRWPISMSLEEWVEQPEVIAFQGLVLASSTVPFRWLTFDFAAWKVKFLANGGLHIPTTFLFHHFFIYLSEIFQITLLLILFFIQMTSIKNKENIAYTQ